MNTLYYGDNLDILRRYIKDGAVDLVYLDPPFNSNQNYNVLFKEQDGSKAASQIRAFDDTWTWDQEDEAVYAEIVTGGGRVADCLEAFRKFLGPCHMLSYIVMMAPRLIELRRVMNETASIYLHCDPSASHYLKMRISSSCPEGAIVLDPFCGCGTTISAAQKLKRQWIGIDITHLAITLMKERLKDTFGDAAQFQVMGEPVSVPDAAALAASDPYQFQWWALGLVGARPIEQKKGADKGIDGKIVFQSSEQGKFETVLISVKAGGTSVAHVRDLRGTIEREKAALGVLITMQEPTAPMRTEAVTTGFYESVAWNTRHPKMQLLTVAELLAGARIDMPPLRQVNATFKKAKKETAARAQEGVLEF